jgi:DNA-directed RNA polymerase specialized sigma subunit
MKKRDELTDHVVSYQENQENETFKKVMRLSEGLINKVFNYYQMNNFPKNIVEEVKDDCKTIKLIEAIDKYDKNRGAAFSTHYVWKLKSFVNCERKKLLRRKMLLRCYDIDKYTENNILPEERAVGEEECKKSVNINSYNINLYNRKQRIMHELFDCV